MRTYRVSDSTRAVAVHAEERNRIHTIEEDQLRRTRSRPYGAYVQLLLGRGVLVSARIGIILVLFPTRLSRGQKLSRVQNCPRWPFAQGSRVQVTAGALYI